MGKTGIWILLVAACVILVVPAGAFIGAGINLDKHLGDTISFNLGKNINAANTGVALADMDLGVTWGVDYDFASMGGYPYGYGGIAAITEGDVGYSLGVSMDEAHGAGFDGSTFGVPLTETSLTRTRFNNAIAANNHFGTQQIALPFTGFPVI